MWSACRSWLASGRSLWFPEAIKPTLSQVFTLSLLGLAALLGMLFYVVFAVTRATIIESSERIRDGASQVIGERVMRFLEKAPATVEQFQSALQSGLIDGRDPLAIEPALLGPLFANAEIGEVTLTYGEKVGFDPNGDIQLASDSRGQWSVWRAPDQNGRDFVWSRHVHQEGGAFVAERRALKRGEPFATQPVVREAGAAIPDPTLHLTFTTPASHDSEGGLSWSDLHWSQLDDELPEAKRRVEVSVQQVVNDAAGKFLGVLRVGLLAQQLDGAIQLDLAGGGGDPHRIFICDTRGRLIAQSGRTARLEEVDGDFLRMPPDAVPEPVASALATPALHTMSDASPRISGHFQRGGEEFLTTFRALPGTQDWLVGIVVPRAFYLGELTAMRDRLLAASLGIIVLLVAGGSFILRGVKRGQAQIIKQSLKMNAFEFSAAPTASAFRDVTDVLESLEKAKAAMRAMGKYAPIDLVRRLYREKSEPMLGGEPQELSIMFTDIKDFTTLSEKLAPNDLAAALGRYLEVMARVIQKDCRGTIDKYIGDAIMTIWNAPEPVPDHARLACLAALRCRDAGRELSLSPNWWGLPAFETRFGLHRDTALVGHFGAPDRMNYTAIGDAVNLASRLESLNKTYGTTIIASERIVENTREYFDFRLLDWVAVKGKSEAIKIYELLGEKVATRQQTAAFATYEKAFAAYVVRDFDAAVALLEQYPDDLPSRRLLERCRGFQIEPPPPNWRGIYIAKTK